MKYFVKIISVALLFMISINAFSPIAYSDYYSEQTTINSDVKIEPVLNNHIRSLLSDIIDAPEAFGYSLSDFYDCYFGKPFTIDCYSQQSDMCYRSYSEW